MKQFTGNGVLMLFVLRAEFAIALVLNSYDDL